VRRGGLKGQQIVDEIFQIEGEAFELARSVLPSLLPCTVCNDFSAAFPSIAHSYLWAALQAHGLDFRFIHAIQQLYQYSYHQISFKGGLFPEFSLLAGVRQGDPLSALPLTRFYIIFAMSSLTIFSSVHVMTTSPLSCVILEYKALLCLKLTVCSVIVLEPR
jgi:hypothetical protein